MWKIVTTVSVGGVIWLVYITVNYIFDNCYRFKTHNYRPRHYMARNFKGCVKAVLNLLHRRPQVFRVVGLDCEMTSTSVRGGHPVPALLQLANPNGYCAIFQLKVIQKAEDKITVPYLSERPKSFKFKLPSENVMREILEDKNVLKVGVAVLNDANYLEESYGLFCKGCLDIRHMAKHVGIEPLGLGYLAGRVLGKEKITRRRNQPWELDHLNDNHIEYAAQDARLGVEIFLELNRLMIEKAYSWPRRLFWDEKTYWKYSLKLLRGYIGKQFEFSTEKDSQDCLTAWANYIPNHSRTLNVVKSLYGRSRLHCETAFKYISFIPESIGSKRICYVCGYPDDASLNVKLKAIVPVDYNVGFLGEESLYYICLCKDCFEDCRTRVDYELRLELTEECGAPYPDYQDHRLNTVKKLALELLTSGIEEGKEWILILEYKLHKMFPDLTKEEFNIRTMEIILSMDCWPESMHGRFVHDYFCRDSDGGLEMLKWRWFERFWKVMRPQHLPPAFINYYRSNPLWHWIMS